MPAFVKTVIIDSPVEAVFAFHEREDVLPLLSPPFPPVRLVRKTPGIAVGARVELRVGFFSWIAIHTVYEKDRLFVDEQVSGPMAKWVHRHEFEDLGGRTRLTDRVEFELPGGRAVNLLFGWLVKAALTPAFRRRHSVTMRLTMAGRGRP